MKQKSIRVDESDEFKLIKVDLNNQITEFKLRDENNELLL